MRRALLAPMVILAGLAACQEVTTPTAAPSPEVRAYRFDDTGDYPPPPASDTGALAQSPEMGSYILNVTYLLNKPETSGFLSFQREQPEGVTVSPFARIRLSQGVLSGKGEIRIESDGNLLVLDLAEIVEGVSSFNGCDAPQGEVTGPSGSTSDEVVQPVSCFRVVIENGRFTPAGSTTSREASDVTFGPCPARGGVCLKSER